ELAEPILGAGSVGDVGMDLARERAKRSLDRLGVRVPLDLEERVVVGGRRHARSIFAQGRNRTPPNAVVPRDEASRAAVDPPLRPRRRRRERYRERPRPAAPARVRARTEAPAPAPPGSPERERAPRERAGRPWAIRRPWARPRPTCRRRARKPSKLPKRPLPWSSRREGDR